jgi:hypothetical protein
MQPIKLPKDAYTQSPAAISTKPVKQKQNLPNDKVQARIKNIILKMESAIALISMLGAIFGHKDD